MKVGCVIAEHAFHEGYGHLGGRSRIVSPQILQPRVTGGAEPSRTLDIDR